MSIPSFRARGVQRLRTLAIAAAALVCCAALGAPKAYVGNFKDSTVSVIDTGSAAVVATIPVAAGPHGMSVSPDGRFVYVTGEGGEQHERDRHRQRPRRADRRGRPDAARPGAAARRQDAPGRRLRRRPGRLLRHRERAASSPRVAVAKPHTIAVRPDGKVAYVASQQPGHFALVVVDLATRAVLREIALDKPPRDPEFSHDGKFPLRHGRRRQRAARDRRRDRPGRRRDPNRRLAAHRQVVRGRAGRHDRRAGTRASC